MPRYSVIVFAAIAMIAACPRAFAQHGGDLAVGARIILANADDVFNSSMGDGASVDEELGYGAMAKLAISHRFWVQFAADAFTFTGELVEPDFKITADLETIPLTATVLFDFVSRENTIRPYIGAGIGYYLNDFDDVRQSTFGFLIDLKDYADFEADNGFGWHLCAGLDWFVTNNLAINAEVLYRQIEYDWEIITSAFGLSELGEDISDSGSDDLDGWAALVGVSLFF